MSLPQEQTTFYRLQHAQDPDHGDATIKEWYKNMPEGHAAYVPEGLPVDESWDKGRMREMCNLLTNKLLWAVEQLPRGKEDIDFVEQALRANDPTDSENALIALQRYVVKHPDVVKKFPVLRVVSVLPPGTGFYLKALGEWSGMQGEEGSVTGVQSQAMEMHLPVAMTGASKYGGGFVGVPITIEAAIHLAAGNLYSADSLITRESGGAYDEGKKNPLDIPGIVRVYKAAREVYGAAWKKEVPEKLTTTTRHIADLEWQSSEANQVWKTDGERAVFNELKNRDELLKQVAAVMRDGRPELSWPFFIMKLWNDEALLREQFIKVRHTSNLPDLEDLHARLDSPLFEDQLAAIGKKMELGLKVGSALAGQVAPEMDRAAHIAAAREQMRGLEGLLLQDEFDEDIKAMIATLRGMQWQEFILPFKQLLQEKAAAPGLESEANKFEEGFYRDFFLNESWQREENKTPKVADRYLERMRQEVPDGAKANRGPDLMNRYVRDHYLEGTDNDAKFRLRYFVAHRADFHFNPDDLALGLSEEIIDGLDEEEARAVLEQIFSHTFGSPGSLFIEGHSLRKGEFADRAKKERLSASNELFVFSDAISRAPSQEGVLDAAFKYKLIAERMKEVQPGVANSGGIGLEKTRDWLIAQVAEPCTFRDFYIENFLNVAVWNFARSSHLGAKLAAEGVVLRQTEVDLHKHLDGKDDGVLQDAYMTNYTVLRVEGLAGKVKLFSGAERTALAQVMREWVALLTPQAAEPYERLAIELEAEHLRGLYETKLADGLRPKRGREADSAQAQDQAFQDVFAYVIERFPAASYNRDELLERFALDYAVTPAQVKQVEEAFYTYLVRKPEVAGEKKEKVAFAPVETVKNYLAAFQDRASRARILGWIFGGELPDDRFLEGQAFNVNPNSEREVFWLMSGAERRAVLYNALLGDNGLFNVDIKKTSYGDMMEKEIFNGFLESFYKNNFESLIRKNAEAKGQEPDAKLEKVLRTVFFSVFKHYSPARRVELFLAITERMREVRLQGKELNAGQAVRLFLEQIGVVGIKAGQTVAEQKSLVNDDIRGELSSLRDRATPFSKFGVFTYLRLGGLMGQRQAADRPAPFQIAQVGECLGSASIKQAHWAKTTEGADVVPKVPRPTIDKNHEEDTYVLGQVFEDLRNEGINFPQHLLHEIIDACASEFDFGQEGETQQAMDANLYARRAKVSLVDKNGAAETVRLDVPDLLFMLRRGDSSVANLQLMVDEGIRGFSIKEVEEWQALTATTAPSPEEQARKEELGLKLEKQYKEYAALVGMEYAGIDMRMLRAQLAMDWITQVMDDGLFHADLHAGNTLVDLTPKRKRVCYIDFGSSGRSVERRASDTVDHRQSFKEFLQSIILMKIGAGNSAERLAGIIARYVEVEGRDQKFWQEKVTQLQQAQPEIGHFFKDLLGEILGEHGKVDRQFKMLLKGLAAGGGHFEALSEQLALSMFQAMQESLKTGVPVGTVVSRQGGFLRQLLPLVEGLPEIQTVLQYSPEDSLRSMAEGLDIGYVVVTGNQVWLAQNPGEAGGAPKSGLVEFNANGTILTGPDGATFDLLHIRYDGPNGLYEYLRRVGTV